MSSDNESRANKPHTIYHYTTADGLRGIVEASEIWASDCRFLNDSKEVRYGVDIIRQALLDEHGDPGAAIADRLLSHLDDPVYVACFCREGDLLSQWRGYAAGHGYAIGVSVGALRASVQALDGALRPVEYGEAGAARLRQVVARRIETWAIPPETTPDELAANNLFDIYTRVLIYGIANVKHQAFEEEHEWRVRLTPIFAERQSLDVRFRSTDVAIIPYTAVPLTAEAIRCVIVGPGGDTQTRVAGVKRFLDAHKISADVQSSNAPLR